MWVLQSRQGTKIYLPLSKTLTFGRKKSDVLLDGDDSISRTHASVTVTPNNGTKFSEPLSSCILKDLGSKYGTYLIKGDKKEQVTEGQEYCLKPNDTILFGLKEHTFTVTYIPIIISGSLLNEDNKKELQTIMDTVDGVIVPEWTHYCTHLTVSIATLTEKVACALACGVPIVTMDYWKTILQATKMASELPDPEKYTPLLSEKYICSEDVSLLPNKARSTIFKDLIFVHMCPKQYKTYAKIISLAGGKSVLYSRTPVSNKNLCARNVVVLQYLIYEETQSTTCNEPAYDEIYEMLLQNKRRMIPESEIPLAILHCSTEKYCNPTYSFVDALKNSEKNIKKDISKTLVIDTQDVEAQSSSVESAKRGTRSVNSMKNTKSSNVILPETIDSFPMESQELPCPQIKQIHNINIDTKKDNLNVTKRSDGMTINIVKEQSTRPPTLKVDLQIDGSHCESEIEEKKISSNEPIIPDEIPDSPPSSKCSSIVANLKLSVSRRIIPETLDTSFDESVKCLQSTSISELEGKAKNSPIHRILPETLETSINEKSRKQSALEIESNKFSDDENEVKTSPVCRIFPETLETSINEKSTIQSTLEMESNTFSEDKKEVKISPVCRIFPETNDTPFNEGFQKPLTLKEEPICTFKTEQNSDNDRNDSMENVDYVNDELSHIDQWVNVKDVGNNLSSERTDNIKKQDRHIDKNDKNPINNSSTRKGTNVGGKRKIDCAFETHNSQKTIVPFTESIKKEIDWTVVSFDDFIRKDRIYKKFKKIPVKIPTTRLGINDFYVDKASIPN